MVELWLLFAVNYCLMYDECNVLSTKFLENFCFEFIILTVKDLFQIFFKGQQLLDFRNDFPRPEGIIILTVHACTGKETRVRSKTILKKARQGKIES